MTSLLSRLKAAPGPSRELDAYIWAEHNDRDVIGPRSSATWQDAYFARSRKPPHDECFIWQPGRAADHIPRYTESIHDVYRYLLRRGIAWSVGTYSGKFTASVRISHAVADSPALALLIALERAKEAHKDWPTHWMPRPAAPPEDKP